MQLTDRPPREQTGKRRISTLLGAVILLFVAFGAIGVVYLMTKDEVSAEGVTTATPFTSKTNTTP